MRISRCESGFHSEPNPPQNPHLLRLLVLGGFRVRNLELSLFFSRPRPPNLTFLKTRGPRTGRPTPGDRTTDAPSQSIGATPTQPYGPLESRFFNLGISVLYKLEISLNLYLDHDLEKVLPSGIYPDTIG